MSPTKLSDHIKEILSNLTKETENLRDLLKKIVEKDELSKTDEESLNWCVRTMVDECMFLQILKPTPEEAG